MLRLKDDGTRAARQPVRRQAGLPAGGLHARPPQLARPGRASRHRRDVAERERAERRRRDQHPQARRQLRLADRELRAHLPGPVAVADSSAAQGFEPPVVYWMPSIAVSGMAFYTGDKLPKWKGDVFVGGMRTGEIPGTGHLERILFNEKMEELRRESLLVDLRQRIRDVRQGPDGLLYLLTDEEQGAMLRIEPARCWKVRESHEDAGAMADTLEHLNLNFINGAWTRARGAATFGNENPARAAATSASSNRRLPRTCTPRCRGRGRVSSAWRRTPLATRQQHIAEFLRLLERSREELARIVTLENGKTIRESRAEVDSALVEGTLPPQPGGGVRRQRGPRRRRAITTWVQYQPLGVVGVISPWNFPMNVMCRKTLPALLTGNTVVFKPASFTPWSGVFMAKLSRRAGCRRASSTA